VAYCIAIAHDPERLRGRRKALGAVGGGQIERVELFIDDTLIATYDNPHLSVALKASFTWQASGVGRHIIKVVAINDDGVASDPASISIEVK